MNFKVYKRKLHSQVQNTHCLKVIINSLVKHWVLVLIRSKCAKIATSCWRKSQVLHDLPQVDFQIFTSDLNPVLKKEERIEKYILMQKNKWYHLNYPMLPNTKFSFPKKVKHTLLGIHDLREQIKFLTWWYSSNKILKYTCHMSNSKPKYISNDKVKEEKNEIA